ncbi:pimeloyl-ACP methyl ester carboxylesterase [Micromonospora pisi]|uniref:Pimeloyl-ACP methyl ester carboxylesterase n=1 Tax=Micromonospora pisi TaxID=589240 RepID=A0A495JFJ5_9ACTN|nr:alpha/beta hydrolase [Micromonospora pisi]RKR87677.1 pimeloyl-ACP methyl ester carboxylesterase [Micromonospora pisi]
MKRRTRWAVAAAGTVLLTVAGGGAALAADRGHERPKPTVVLVHGALEDASAWHDVISRLQRDGYPVVAPAVPLRGLKTDSEYLASVVDSIDGPVVLAGHSYGGMLINEVGATDPDVKALVYVAAFIPRAGESAGQLNAQFPGSLLGPDTTFTRTTPDGVTDLYVKPQSFRAVFAGGTPAGEAAVAAASQRPINAAAFDDKAVRTAPSSIRSYALVATEDRAIPPAAERFMAKRAGATTVEVRSAHNVPVAHPGTVADLLEKAADSTRR